MEAIDNPLVERTPKLEQHILLRKEPLREFLGSLHLGGASVVELGTGTGELTRLIIEQRPAEVRSYEIDPSIVPNDLRSEAEIICQDFTKTDFSYLCSGEHVLIASPPYSHLEWIKHDLIDRYRIEHVAILIPESKRSLFPDFQIGQELSGADFTPPAKGNHLFVYRGFSTAREVPLEELPGIQGRELRAELGRKLQLSPESCWKEDGLLDDLLSRVDSEIDRLGYEEKMGRNRRVVVFLTENPRKLPEFKESFSRYGVEVAQAADFEQSDFIRRILKMKKDGVRILSVMRETSNIVIPGTETLSMKRDLDAVENLSVLRAYSLDEQGALCGKQYTHRTAGRIDASKTVTDKAQVFGWDDIFVVNALGKTYHEIRSSHGKVSSRDVVVSEYIAESLHYRKRVDLNFQPQGQKRAIDFGNSVQRYLRKNPLLNTEMARTYGITRLFQSVVNSGTFFRAAINRRQKNYWFAGLNAGLPLVPKKDAIHETTFNVHDVGHMRKPLPIYTGQYSKEIAIARNAYNMMGEAMTLVEADMLFADSLKKSGVEYDYAKRRIHPLFESFDIDIREKGGFLENLRTVMYASARYCLTGDDSYFRALIRNPEGEVALEAFKEKYMPFFVEDFRWNERNFNDMTQRSEEFSRWWEAVKPIRDNCLPDLFTCQELVDRLSKSSEEIVDRTFNDLFENCVVPTFSHPVEPEDAAVQRSRAFARYMMGQLAVFSRFDFLLEAREYQERLIEYVLEHSDGITLEEVERGRAHYEQGVDILQQKNLITPDDAITYKEVYPLFEPYYVFYDEEQGFYEDLPSISKRILGVKA